VLDSVIPEWVVADPTRLKQVMHNLLSNAIKFTKKGRICLHVKFTTSTHSLQIEVVDTGEGIAADKQSLIFESFRQADTSITRNFGGTGLGLFITKNLVKLMGGVVDVESTLGVGSRFTVTIVCQSNEGECHSISNREIVDVKPLLIPSLMGDILLVEDTRVNQQLITFNLEKTGAKVDLAENGEEGLQKALTNPYDLILMDIQMPVMDGKEAMRSLQQLGISIPTYALTANVMPSDIKEYTEIGFTGTLNKPLELANLYQVLGQHLTICTDKVRNEEPGTKLLVQDPEIRALFYTELTKQHNQITVSIQNVDYVSLIQITHIIKGSAASFGYDNLTNLAEKSLLHLRQKQYVQAVEHCTHLNHKIAEILNDYKD